MIWLHHPFGNSNVRSVLRACDNNNLISRFYTSIAVNSESYLLNILPKKIAEELRRKIYPIKYKKIHQCASIEYVRQLIEKLKIAHIIKWPSSDVIWNCLDRHVAKELGCIRKKPDAIYAYEDGAHETFKIAKRYGIKCIYDLPIGYYESAQKIFKEDVLRLPEFSGLLDGINDSEQKLINKKNEALLADIIISCSPFVTDSLIRAGYKRQKIHEVQFGAPSHHVKKMWSPADVQGKLKVVFVGRVTQRKGIGYLLKAFEELKNSAAELHVVGSISGDVSILKKYAHLFKYYPPMPQFKIYELMKNSHILVLPSLFEGQALVVLEAMKVGIPVIITKNTGASEIVTNGREGFIVDVGSKESIKDKLLWALDNRYEIANMGEAAYSRASIYTWEKYEEKIATIIKSII